jgi:hypothetical protein
MVRPGPSLGYTYDLTDQLQDPGNVHDSCEVPASMHNLCMACTPDSCYTSFAPLAQASCKLVDASATLSCKLVDPSWLTQLAAAGQGGTCINQLAGNSSSCKFQQPSAVLHRHGFPQMWCNWRTAKSRQR